PIRDGALTASGRGGRAPAGPVLGVPGPYRPGPRAPSLSSQGGAVGLEPGGRIHRFAVVADLEIQLGGSPAAGIPGLGDGLTGPHRLAHRLEQSVVMAIEAHITLAMIHDPQQAQPWKPIGVHPA